MNIRLSKEKIETFCGDVVALQLIADEDLSYEPITWSAEGEVLSVKGFADDEEFPFRNGVLLTMKQAGNTTVTAEYQGKRYDCPVTVRPARTLAEGEPIEFFAGDFHDHTTTLHNHDQFVARDKDFPIDYLNAVKKDGRLAFGVISDHAIVTNARDFFRGFTDNDQVSSDTVIFPGTESEVTFIEHDRFGLSHKNSGEIVCVNANNFKFSRTWQPFWDAFSDAPFAVCVLAHPQVVGWDKNGIWNFQLHKNNTPLMKQLIKGVEMGQGYAGNMLYEFIYSVALDCGFKVSVTSSSDCHGPNWGYDAWPGKTVIMAPEKSKEMFLDALLHRRFYATESGNVKLWYTVNGKIAGETLPLTDTYHYNVTLDYFKDDPSTVPVKCQVISDYGMTVKTLEDFGNSFEFTVTSETARYFYLRFVDAQGRKTWSAPVWTGREGDDTTEPKVAALDKKGMTAVDLTSGKDAAAVINDDPMILWEGEKPTAEIVIDMKKPQTICALGHYPARYLMEYFQKTGANDAETFARFAHEYEISLSDDGEAFTPVAHGVLRIFGGEEILTFPESTARYVKFRVLSTIGKACDRPPYANATVSISELTPFRAE